MNSMIVCRTCEQNGNQGYDASVCGGCVHFDKWEESDLVRDVRMAERERCAKICADRAAMLEATADQYPAGTAVCFAAEALECERQIRGEG